MAMGPGKRKRGDRSYSHDEGPPRASPHRPASMQLAQQNPHSEFRHRSGGYQGNRRPSRGGRGGIGPRHDGGHLRSPTTTSNTTRAPSAPSAPSAAPAPLANNAEVASTQPPVENIGVTKTQSPKQEPVRDNAVMSSSTSSTEQTLYYYEYITDDKVTSWMNTGRQTVIDAGVQARHDEDAIALGILFQELLQAGLSGRIDITDAGSVIKEVIGESPAPAEEGNEISETPQLAFDAKLLFLDLLSIVTENDIPAGLRTLIIATGIAPKYLRLYLEAPLLESLGLIRSTFGRMNIRKTTNLLYRQSNYNLLREETEGYSKLMTELFTTSCNEPPSGEVVGETLERVKALIGAFDLDVGRVLDVILDVFASVLVKQNRFYIKLLRSSPWWPKEGQLSGEPSEGAGVISLPSWALPGVPHWQNTEDEKNMIRARKETRDRAFWGRLKWKGIRAFFHLGRQRVDEDNPVQQPEDDVATKTDISQKWIKTTGTSPPSGNRVAAQLLGFKLRFYSSNVRDANDVLPVNIIYLSALLIKIGFISLVDLYPHVWPFDDKMATIKREKLKEKAEKERLKRPGGGAANALMMAGALPDDTAPPPPRARDADVNRQTSTTKADGASDKVADTANVDDKDKLPEPLDQKVLLLKSLLCIGALPESLFILSRFPWLPDTFPELLEYIHRIMHHSLNKIYEPLRPLRERESLREAKKTVDPESSNAGDGPLPLADIAPRRVLRWALPDKDDTSEGTEFRFYWDDWADNVPICQSIDDVFLLCQTFGRYSGVKIGTDPALLVKLVRIGRHSLAEDPSKENTERWVDLSKRLLVPALSLTKRNPGVVNEVYDLLKIFPIGTRYMIYEEWFTKRVSRLPDIKAAFEQTRAETKDVMKRISKTNIKPMARALAKAAYSSPGVVFSVALNQIESYDNLVEVVVECARYFTYLGYDVLTWSLMSSLSGQGRDRVQADGMLTSKWLAALSLFAGRIFKRYSSLMNPSPILQYVTNQLRKGNTVDLIVLKEMITSMAGIVPDTNFNDSQIWALSGGELLRQLTFVKLLDKRYESRTTAKRFIRALTEPPLAGQLLISMAQARQTCIFGLSEQVSHLKLLGNLTDEVHRVLSQYLDLLRTNMTPSEFNSLVPDVSQLIADYGIEPSIAFWISRPSITHEMHEYDEATSKKVRSEGHPALVELDGDQDTKMVELQPETTSSQDEKRENEEQANATKSVESANGDEGMKDLSSFLELSSGPPSTELNGTSEPWHPVLSSLMKRLKTTLPNDTWTNLIPGFYVTFWQLSLYDIQVPAKSYEEEIARLQRQWMKVNDDRSDPSVAGSVRREKEKKQLTETQNRLSKEMRDHIQSFSNLKDRLAKEKDHWFAGFWGKWDDLNDALIELCLLPRLLVSPTDALYSFKVLRLLHSIGTANFRTMGLIDHLLREGRLSNLVYVCTAREAENLGRFLNELLKELSRWHADRATYEREAFGNKKNLPGFAKKLVKDKVPETLLDYEDFRRLLYKWHKNINSALKSCLTGGEYMHIRNAIIILKAVSGYFPAVNWNGRDQVTSVTELSKSEKRNDIKIAATSLLGDLKKREKKWMLPQEFNLIESASNAATTKLIPTQPQQQKAMPSLNANTPAFQPKPQPHTNSSANKQGERRKHEVEDGEIDDARVKRARLLESTSTPGDKKRSPPPATSTPSSTSKPTAAVPTVAPSTVHNEISTRQGMPVHSTTTGAIPSSTEINSGSRNNQQLSSQNRPSSYGDQARQDPSRNQPLTPASVQAQHSLPKRPENLPPPISRNGDWRASERSNTGDRRVRDSRDGPLAEGKKSEHPMEPSREYNGDRRTSGPSAGPRRQERSSDGPGAIERSRNEFSRVEEKNLTPSSQLERFNSPHTRDIRPTDSKGGWSGQSIRDRPGPNESVNHMRTTELAPPARNTSMAPPRANTSAHIDRNASMNNELDRRESRTQDRNERRERPSRPSSPPRGDERRGSGPESRFEVRRDDHQVMNERRPSAEHEGMRANRHEPTHPPTGPRGDRNARITGQDNSTSSFDRPRDLFQQNPPTITQPVDLNQGRLNQDPGFASRQLDPNYGRLNPTPEIPSGPRRNIPGRGGLRTASASHPSPTIQMDGRNQMPPHSLHSERPPPTGPSSNSRVGHRSGSLQFDYPQSGLTTAPQTPVTESVPNDLAGVHPDRLKGLQRANELPTSNHGRAMGPHAEAATPTASNTYPSAQTTSPPSGPRGSQQQLPSPVGPPSVARHPPTGPASVSDRSRGDKRFAGLQTVLQQAGTSSTGTPERTANERGTNIRGRGGRSNTNGVNAPSSHSGPPTPVNGRADYMFSRPNNGLMGTPEEDSRSMTASSRNGRTRDDDNREGGGDFRSRSGRYRSSRSQSPHRGEHGNNSRRERDREHDRERIPRRDDHRDHRSGGTSSGREDNRRGVREDPGRDRDRRDRVVAENNHNNNTNNGGPGAGSWGATASGVANANERRSNDMIRSGGGGRERLREGDRERERDREREVRDRDHHRQSSSRRPMVGGPGATASGGDLMNSRKRGRNDSDIMTNEGRVGGGGSGGGGQSHHGAGGDNKRVRRHP